ncbi:MAG: hypothetical protein MRY64_14880 [Hyphomonadaceae bacterium]|nr:hypothetical protein [Hyphomonadaceae bacterium]
MNFKLQFFLAGAAFSVLAACQTAEPDQEPAVAPAPEASEPASAPEPEIEMEGEMGEAIPDCPVLESANWAAWINKMPGPDAQATLHVTGDVTMPTPGYTLELTEGAMDRMMPPGLHLILSATPPGPDEMVMQVLTTETVSFEGPAIPQGYRKIAIVCNGAPLAEITEIEEVS